MVGGEMKPGAKMNRIVYTLFCLSLMAVNCAGQSSKIDSLQNIADHSKTDSAKVDALNGLFLEYEYTYEIKAKECLRKAFELSEKTGYKRGLSYCYTNSAYLAEDKGNFPDALKNHFTALKIRERYGDKKATAESYNNVGLIYYYQGNCPSALKSYFRALKIKDSALQGPQKVEANSYNNIGLVYQVQGNLPDALKNHLSALEIRKKVGDTRGVAGSYNNIGNILLT